MLLSLTASAKQLDMANFLYNVDVDGTTLLHLAVDGGVAEVSTGEKESESHNKLSLNAIS